MSAARKIYRAPLGLKAGDKGQVEAVIATFNVVDKDGDYTLPGAFTDGSEVLISAYGHSSWTGQPPVGKGVIRTTTRDARLHGQFFLDTQSGKEHFTVLRELGSKGHWSYGFDVLETGELTDELRKLGATRVLKRLDVFEVSPVLLGAGVDTRTVATKTCQTCGAAPGASCQCHHGDKTVLSDAERAAVDVGIAEHIARDVDLAADRPPGVKEIHRVYVEGADLDDEALAAACTDLGLSGLKIRYFDPESRPGVNGFFSRLFPAAIWISAKLRGPYRIRTIGHEAHHAASGDAPDEAAAAAYGLRLQTSDWSSWPTYVRPRIYDR